MESAPTSTVSVIMNTILMVAIFMMTIMKIFLRTIMILVLTIEIAGGSSDTSEQGDLSRDGLSGAIDDQIIIR